MKGPSMVGANKRIASIATLVANQLNTSVRTAVVKHIDATRFVSHHDHGLTANIKSEVVARVLDLGLMAAIHPSRLKDVLHFKIKEVLICVNAFVDPIGLYKLV
jgi:hypothetical protein